MIYQFNHKKPQIPESCYISDSVDIIGDVILGEQVNIWFGTVIRGDMHSIKIGDRTNIQDNCTVHVTTEIAPTNIGSDVTIGHNAIIHGCTIEDQCLIGMGAIIMDNAIIRKGSIIGAGAVVKAGDVIEPKSLCVGIPAKVVRKVSNEEYKEIKERASHYVEYAEKFKRNANK
jgi:gamma-carbonic anhydrase